MENRHNHEEEIEHYHKLLNKNFMVIAFVVAIVMAFILFITIGINNNFFQIC